MSALLDRFHPAKPEDPASEGPKLLANERTRATFHTRDMTELLFGGKAGADRREYLANEIVNDPIFSSTDRPFMNHSQQYARSLQKAHYFIKKMKKLGVQPVTEEWGFCYFNLGEVLPIDVHNSMFLPTLMRQTTPEQMAKWLPLAQDFKILGAYAQTELGHGSNVRGLETTATYDKRTQEFVINSPTLTSTKWWPGGLGRTATHTILIANLIIDGKEYGMHTFLVQLRSLKDHSALPGIILGDIGPKVGFQGIDNGYAAFENIRIPRDQMLMRFAQVTPEGKYIQPPGHQMQYITMLHVRANIIKMAGFILGLGTTICTRYSAVRKQGSGPKGTELAVLDYKQQQSNLFPLIAISYAAHFVGDMILKQYYKTMEAIDRGDLSLLPEMHATSSIMKGLFSHLASDGMEHCRRMCGGHGFSYASGIPEKLGNLVASCTYEGTVDILAQQTARYLIKSVQRISEGKKVTGAAKYLERMSDSLQYRSPARSIDDLRKPENLLPIFASRACREISRVALKFSELTATRGKNAWFDLQAELVVASLAHAHHAAVEMFFESVKTIQNPKLRAAVGKLATLFAVELMIRDLGQFRDGDVITSAQALLGRELKSQLLDEIRPDAVALNDAWNTPDKALSSCLGVYKGNVYEELARFVEREPLNKTPIPDGYEDYIKPLVFSERARL